MSSLRVVLLIAAARIVSAGGLASGLIELGDGGDKDPTTFSFHPDNRVAPLLNQRGRPTARTHGARVYGSAFAVLADGKDVCTKHYAWRRGYAGDQPVLTPKVADLSEWGKATDEPGFVLIDTQTGRLKFAGPNAVAAEVPMRLVKRVVLGAFEICGFKARGPYLYCAMGEEAHALLIIDFRDPTKPAFAGYSAMGGYAVNCALGENHAYVMTTRRQAHIADIRDPYDVKSLKTYAGGWSYHGGVCFWNLEEKKFYVHDRNGLTCYDTTDEDDPMPMASWQCGISGFEVVGDLVYGSWTERVPTLDDSGKPVKDKKGKPVMETATYAGVKRLKPDSTSEVVGQVRVPGARVGRGSVVRKGIIGVITQEGVGLVDASNPQAPKLSSFHQGPKYKTRYGVKWGMTDLWFHKERLLVTCAADVSVGVTRGHRDFERLLKEKLPEVSGKSWPETGGLLVFDVSDPAQLKLAGQLDTYTIGFGPVGRVMADDSRDVAYLHVGPVVCAVDLKDPSKPKLLSWIIADGELNQARYFGGYVYAMNRGLFIIKPYPIEKAQLVGYTSHGGGRFGVLVSGSPQSNVLTVTGNQGCKALVDITRKDRPRQITPKDPWPGGYARWDYPYCYARGPVVYKYDPRQQTFAEVYRATPPGNFRGDRVLVGDGYFYEICMSGRKKKGTLLRVWKIVCPSYLELVGELEWLVGGGWDWPGNPYYYDHFIFFGDLVIDVADPTEPKVVNRLSNMREDIACYSAVGGQTFYVRDGTLYTSNYFTGLHAWDVSQLRAKNRIRYIGVWRDEKDSWAVGSVYCRSVDGYGRYLFATDFGNVNIFEIPTKTEVPSGKLEAKVFIPKPATKKGGK